MKKLTALIAALAIGGFAVSAQAVEGGSCAESVLLTPGGTFSADTTTTTNWIGGYGPASSPSNDYMFTFTTGTTAPTGSIVPTAGFQFFAMYLLNACSAGTDNGVIGATGTVGTGISLAGITAPSTPYWLAITGAAAGGPAANGVVTFTTPDPLPVTLQEFQIN